MEITDKGLYLGFDAEKTVVAAVPLRLKTGRAIRRRFGSVTELVPAPPSGRSREDRVRFVSRLALPLVLLGAVLYGAGLPWWAPVVGGAALLGFVAREQARAARPGTIMVPPGEDAHVLIAAEERAAYERAVVVSRRIRRTWPALGRLVDPADADRMLTRALGELATLMARRQQIRRLRAELSEVNHRELPADSPAVAALAAQRSRVETLWRETGGQANHMLGALNAAALAGENLIREQRVHATARDAELTISRLTVAGAAPAVDAGPELAERTAAVIAAYRELRTGF